MMRWMGCFAAAFLLVGAGMGQEPATSASVEQVEVEKIDGGLCFRASVVWPAEGIGAQPQPAPSQGRRMGSGWWAHDALALIPQSPEAFRVCREVPAERDANERFIDPRPITEPRSPAVFVGRLREAGDQRFLLRCPQADGKWQYLPLTIDFTQAKPAEGLYRQWLNSQAAMMDQLRLGDNSFFTYARNYLRGKSGTPVESRPEFQTGEWSSGSERLYEVTTGALAMQESLQLDRLRNAPADTGPREVPIGKVEGITVRAHPWKEMIGARQPQIEPIAALVPEDQYYVRFTTTRALSEFLEFADAWGGSLLGMAETGGRDYGAKEKIETQICLRSSWLSKLLGPAVLESLAITGSDPYLREGSDLTIIFGLKVAPVFEAAVNRYIDEARKQHADISEGKQDYAGISIEHLTTPDLVVRCYRARLGEYFIYSNSPVAIRRSIDAHAGKVPSLAKSLDFAYIRTLYPLGDKQEDGFVFLSDPFIRSVVGPRTRIAEKRRIETVTSLEMMKNAALLYLWERPGEKVPSLDALCEAGYLDRKHLQTEPGDRLSWDAAAFAGRSERYGRVGHLTPIIELPMDKVTAREQSDYDQFRERYQNYWRRYFDPIGMRITAGRDIALSVTILPLIDNSEYNRMKSVVGGAPADLAPPKAAASAVLYTGAHLNLENPDLKMLQTQSLTMMPGSPQASVQWIGERLRFWIDDSDAFARLKGFGEAFEIPVVLGIEVKNPLGLAAFLVGVQSMIRTSAPNMIVFEPTEAYREHSFTRIRPSSEGMLAGDPDMSKAALYFGSVGRFFYLSTSLKSLHNIVDSAPSSAPAGEAASAPAATQPAVMGHFALRLGLANAQHAKEAAELYLGQATVMAEESHRQNLLLLAQTVGLGEKAVATQQQVLGYSIVSALGNVYGYDAAHDEIVGSVSGSTWEPTKASSIPDDSPLGRLLSSIRSISAHLAFTEDGLQTHLRIERN